MLTAKCLTAITSDRVKIRYFCSETFDEIEEDVIVRNSEIYHMEIENDELHLYVKLPDNY